MSLTRKFLLAMGIEADKVDEIINAHIEVTDALKAERDELKASVGNMEKLQKELADAKKALEAQGTDEYKEKFDALEKEYKEYKADVDAKALEQVKDKAYRAMLKDAGISEKRIDSIMKVTDLKAVEMDGEKLKDLENLSKAVKEEWKDFIVTEGKEGADTDNPPADNGGNGGTVSIPTII